MTARKSKTSKVRKLKSQKLDATQAVQVKGGLTSTRETAYKPRKPF